VAEEVQGGLQSAVEAFVKHVDLGKGREVLAVYSRAGQSPAEASTSPPDAAATPAQPAKAPAEGKAAGKHPAHDSQ
jgi:hypothetical protein